MFSLLVYTRSIVIFCLDQVENRLMGKFKPGESGNLKGRPKGVPDRRNVYREALHEKAPEIVSAVIEKALEGDLSAMRICIDRIIPALKASDSAVNIKLSGELAEKGNQVLEALGTGSLSPGEAVSVMSTLQTQTRLIETSELVTRIEALEATKK